MNCYLLGMNCVVHPICQTVEDFPNVMQSCIWISETTSNLIQFAQEDPQGFFSHQTLVALTGLSLLGERFSKNKTLQNLFILFQNTIGTMVACTAVYSILQKGPLAPDMFLLGAFTINKIQRELKTRTLIQTLEENQALLKSQPTRPLKSVPLPKVEPLHFGDTGLSARGLKEINAIFSE